MFATIYLPIRYLIFEFIVITCLLGLGTTALAGPKTVWDVGGTAVCTTNDDQDGCRLAPDGQGGVLFTWIDYHSDPGDGDIYAQRFTADGLPVWTANGVAVWSNYMIINDSPFIQLGGDGKALVILRDRGALSYELYGKSIAADGTVAGGSIYVCTGVGSIWSPDAKSDGANGMVAVWEDPRSTEEGDGIYGQRISGAGAVQWTANGIPLLTYSENGSFSDPELAMDDAAYVVSMFQVQRTNWVFEINAQKANFATGARQWGNSGVTVCNGDGVESYSSPHIAPDATGGAYIIWSDSRNATESDRWDLYALRLASNGSSASGWSDGIRLTSSTCYSTTGLYSRIVADGRGGALVLLVNSLTNIRLFRLDSEGKDPDWPANGMQVTTSSGDKTGGELVCDGRGGAFITWRHDLTSDQILLQRVNRNGAIHRGWDSTGLVIGTGTGYRSNPQITLLKKDEVAVAWEDRRSGNSDIYAQRVRDCAAPNAGMNLLLMD